MPKCTYELQSHGEDSDDQRMVGSKMRSHDRLLELSSQAPKNDLVKEYGLIQNQDK